MKSCCSDPTDQILQFKKEKKLRDSFVVYFKTKRFLPSQTPHIKKFASKRKFVTNKSGLATLARRLYTTFIDPVIISPLLACRLIALDKNPGIRPIGIGETVRRIIAKAVLYVISTNAFNSLNKAVALHNIQHLCPSFSTILINTYRHPACLYVDGDILYSEEGTTQGDPLAMPFYALATVPLIQKLTTCVTEVWYADDAAACGKISAL